MKTKLHVVSFLCVFFLLYSFNSIAQYTWHQKANYGPGNRGECSGFAIGTIGYIITGYDGSTYYTDVWAWDQGTNTWTKKGNFPGAGKRAASAVSCGGTGFLVGGQSSSGFTTDLWEYFPNSDTWKQKSSFPGPGRYRGYAVADTVNAKIYYGCGDDLGSNYLGDFWVYDIKSDTWAQKASFPGGFRSGPCGFYLNGFIYWGTGNNGDQIYEATHDWWKYDPTTDTWSQVTGLPRNFQRRHAVTFTFGGQGYITLGDSTGVSGNSGFLTDTWMYDPTNDTWTQEASYGGVGSALAVGFSIGNIGYAGTGGISGNAYTSEFWEYLNTEGINEISDNSVLLIYPNPANSCIYISLKNALVDHITYSIYNFIGQEINQEEKINNKTTKINLAELPTGYYFIKIFDNNKETIKKFTIIR